MRSKPVVKIVLLAVLWLAGGLVAEAQIGNLMQRAKKSVSSKTETKVKNLLDGEKAVQEAGLKTMGEMGGGKSYYVSREKGSARAEGTKESPMKDIQKAIDQASDGDVIRIARGNYLGNPPNKTTRLIGGKVAGKLIIRNCMFLNASFNGIILTNMGGDWEIYNNVFVSNLYASCEINGGLNQNTGAHQSTVDFHHNTVLFSWPTTKEMESMGYGYRFKNGADHTVHHNIFGCNNYGALDAGWDDSNLSADKRKICSAYDNLFFMNKGDIVLAGTSGGKWLYVPAKRFDEVEMLTRYENNRELPASSNFKDVIDQPYLKGFASLKVMTTESYDPNSAANLYREAHGLNKQGTSTTRVSMFGNRYNFDKAVLLFGAEPGYGAQLPENE